MDEMKEEKDEMRKRMDEMKEEKDEMRERMDGMEEEKDEIGEEKDETRIKLIDAYTIIENDVNVM